MTDVQIAPPKVRKPNMKIQFEYFAPQAKQVQLGGTFNNWDPAKTPLKKDREGRWKASLELPAGSYEYRYFVDSDWQNDPRTVKCIPNAFGSWNCVLEVE